MKAFRSIFGKLMTTYLVVILITVLVLGILFSQLFQNFYLHERKQALLEAGQRINSILLNYRQGQISWDQVSYVIHGIDRSMNAEIWLVDSEGRVYLDSRPGEEQWFSNHLGAEDMARVLRANVVTRTGFFGNRFDVAVISVGIPLFLEDEVAGAIFLHSPIYGIESTLQQVNRLILIAAIITSIFAVLIGYFMSRRISSPLQEISHAALQMADGDFNKQVTVNSEDEIGRLAESFNYMAQQLQQLEDMRREFIANVSHELRSPLTSIKGFVSGMLDGTINGSDQHRYLQIVSSETNRLSRLVNDLLDLARIEAGKVELSWQRVELNRLLRGVILKFIPRVEEKQLEVSLDTKEDEVWVTTDPDRLEQIIVNLLDNALRFTPSGKSITVAVESKAEKILISVEDEGTGIPPEQLKDIWERFHKADKARTRSKGGTGLGLAIVKKLVQAMDETITVESEQGQGSRFTFTVSKS
ncbi:cell wall metabolism sensor histidine kinase WalK [Metallumcola ferriviriculae]|uniref:histidine kinase n=1 Tax=Metallumcola ferriviriculae TaxID=3039180 RepID=A0AAU0UIL7_9FIRM|nr:cell wall metabolism sensor histidine kinase WalK [Desulfitibacteraceae bacterium MK1]